MNARKGSAMKALALFMSSPAIAFLLASVPAFSQEIRIGHLETHDDIALNWIYLHCNQQGETLGCDSFQTLMPAPCKVLNDYSHIEFKWNVSSQNWVSRQSPSGVCGIASVETLEKDKTSIAGQFWLYTMRRTTTNPTGTATNGMSCSLLTDQTLHYTWRATPTQIKCGALQNLMN